ncbi:cardiolipin synthase [Roseivirga sp. E12]|uniref:cardiolipin synthase n=1 Tax=Roseivirga sp. E12 TaxID=2819237 RepID=UPI001ABC7E8E|nr:cardiolipin synthase [Roseivirga sp. E12]MBO3698451.1 cardiolipin synthase [Roseivirga sp. E12]
MLGVWEIISPYILPLYYVIIFFVVINLLLENRNPLKTHSYLLLLLLLPIVGVLIYFFFGQHQRKRKVFAKRGLINQAFGPLYAQEHLDQETKLGPDVIRPYGQFEKLIRFLKNDLSPLTFNNKVTVLRNGEEKFPVMMKALKNAKDHIHLEYYIFEDDAIGAELAEALIQKAQEGVEVRMLVDGVGSLALKKSFFKRLKASGIQLVEFMPVLFPSFTSKINYRDHRKILIVDGKIGFTGGINVSDRYINNGSHPEYWRDTHLMIEGEAVKTLQFLFFLNWQFVIQHELENQQKYFPEFSNSGGHCVQINASGPDWELASIMDSFLIAITSARSVVRIATPYFIPTESILDAITTVSKSDVRVELMIPYESDSWIVQAASLSFIEELLEAGIHIYYYQKGFLHSKVIMIDKTFASVGTANMDYRSFDLNHEVNTYLYDEDLVETLHDQFEEDKLECIQITLEDWRKRGLRQKLKESVCRLLAPLL